MATKQYREVYAELEYFNKHNTLVYYRNNLTRNNFDKLNDELFVLNDQQTFKSLNISIQIKVHSRRLKDIFDDRLPEGIYIKGGLNGFGIVLVVAEKNVSDHFHFKVGKIEISIRFSGSLETIPWNDNIREKTYLKTYRINPIHNTSIPKTFNSGLWRSK